MNQRIRAVFSKELRDFRRNKFVVGTMIVLPLVLIVIPIGNILGIKAGTPEAQIRAIVGGASLTFFLVPLILPTVIAGYAVVGEREQGTLEPVLTTPVSGGELLMGKALAAIVPTVSIAYGLYLVYALVIRTSATHAVVDLVWQPAQGLAVILFAPLLATFSIWVGLAISARSSDVRVAQQLAALAMLPVLGLTALFTFRVISPTVTVAVVGAILLVVVDAVAWRVVSAMFDRERILTRYGRS
jgi:ABC-2 type transport system permease protein